MMLDVNGEKLYCKVPYQTGIVIKKVEKSCMRTFSHMVQSYLDNPGISVMMKLKAKMERKSNNFILNIRKSCVQVVVRKSH